MTRILIIDDAQASLAELAPLLAAAGHSPVIARDQDHALGVIGEGDLGLIVVCLWHHHIDGMRVIREAKKSDVGLPVLAISDGRSLPGFDDGAAARLMGADEICPVPIGSAGLDQITECIDGCLRKAQAVSLRSCA